MGETPEVDELPEDELDIDCDDLAVPFELMELHEDLESKGLTAEDLADFR